MLCLYSPTLDTFGFIMLCPKSGKFSLLKLSDLYYKGENSYRYTKSPYPKGRNPVKERIRSELDINLRLCSETLSLLHKCISCFMNNLYINNMSVTQQSNPQSNIFVQSDGFVYGTLSMPTGLNLSLIFWISDKQNGHNLLKNVTFSNI